MAVKGMVIAAPRSGAGKTLVSLGIMAALRARGIRVQPFKVGPDFIDPGLHTWITGVPSYNLDGWMMHREAVCHTFAQQAAQADVAVVEGVMGLFDGVSGHGMEGSTAQIASWLGLPVILVVDASSMAGSVAPLIKGFKEFHPHVSIPLVILNKVGSQRHRRLLQEALGLVDGVEIAGFLPRDRHLSLPSRHLGLVTAGDLERREEWILELGAFIEEHLDLDLILERLPAQELIPSSKHDEGKESVQPSCSGPKIGVAMDRAFCFYYRQNLDMLQEAGGLLHFFSPLEDKELPEGLRAIYLGGGYPELHAQALSSNASMIESIRAAHKRGVFIYAECGGMIYLAQGLIDINGKRWKMAGLLPIEVEMTPRFQALGYREVELLTDSILGPKGTTLRGHEFHYSKIVKVGEGLVPAFRTKAPSGEQNCHDGVVMDNIVASYIHLHLKSAADVAPHLITELNRRY